MANSQRVVVLGGGSFGTTLANIMAEKGHDAVLWLRDEARAEEINRDHRNSGYLPDFVLHSGLQARTDLAAAVADRDFVFMAVPSSSCRAVAQEVARHIDARSILISTTKGLEASQTPEPNSFRLMSEVLREEIPGQRLGVLSGPNLAKEIAAKQITATVIASSDEALNTGVQQLLHCGYFRVYASADMFGVELAGALKNAYAIIAGMAAALGIGHNTISLLITRALAEMTRFAVRKGADPLTFMGLAGIGDLMVTCMSPLSRNYQVGVALGQGKNLETIVTELGQVAEGINTLKLLKLHSEQINVRMPLVAGLYEILYDGRSIPEVVGKLMWAEQNRDVEFSLK
ncbi:MAG TPA: NAD(P)H-dependent glycerol-3-phosphate dehydrogenase [Spongiibacteraceae bacterium]